VVGVAAPRLPGAARAVLESFGVTAAPLREALVASMGDLYEPHHRGILFSAGPQLVLERPTWRRWCWPTPRSSASMCCWH
jgi:hypothetical protein